MSAVLSAKKKVWIYIQYRMMIIPGRAAWDSATDDSVAMEIQKNHPPQNESL